MSFKLEISGKEKTFDKKVTLIDLIDNKDKSIICARVNNRLRELTYEVSDNAKVEFLTVKDGDAVRIYEASLRYVVAMAFAHVYPELDIRFAYNVSRSVFVQILNEGMHASPTMVQKVKEEMDRIIAADYPLVRESYLKEEAVKIYKENRLHDKLDALEYRPEKSIHLYECNGYHNYMFSRMVPSTGYLKEYELFYYSPGMILQYPRAEVGGVIHHSKMHQHLVKH